jgi:hypothetical protein
LPGHRPETCHRRHLRKRVPEGQRSGPIPRFERSTQVSPRTRHRGIVLQVGWRRSGIPQGFQSRMRAGAFHSAKLAESFPGRPLKKMPEISTFVSNTILIYGCALQQQRPRCQIVSYQPCESGAGLS